MNFRCWRIIAVLLLLPGLAAAAEMHLQILQLRSRQAAEVLPMLQPFLEPGATLTGTNDKLFLKTTPDNAAEIRRLLESLDRPAKNLIVRISQNRDTVIGNRGAGASASIGLGSNARVIQTERRRNSGGEVIEIRRGESSITARAYDQHSVDSGRGTQSVQVIEGGRAMIQVGVSLPIPLRQVIVGPRGPVFTDVVVYRDIGQGFYVEPRLLGDRVSVEISQQADSPAAFGTGSANVQRLATTVSGRLGEWIPLGGSDLAASGERDASNATATRQTSEHRGFWLRVEEAP